jgi:hypothetical protein
MGDGTGTTLPGNGIPWIGYGSAESTRRRHLCAQVIGPPAGAGRGSVDSWGIHGG